MERPHIAADREGALQPWPTTAILPAHRPGSTSRRRDVDAGRAFYQALFGWANDEPAPPEYGGYSMFRKDGKLVGGSGPLMEGGHPAWTTYVRTADAAATAQQGARGGGEVVVEPMQIMTSGTMAIFKDPTGAYCGVWQNGDHTGAELFNAPGALTWNELTRATSRPAKRFYGAVFGWTAKGDNYVEWQLAGRTIAGCRT